MIENRVYTLNWIVSRNHVEIQNWQLQENKNQYITGCLPSVVRTLR